MILTVSLKTAKTISKAGYDQETFLVWSHPWCYTHQEIEENGGTANPLKSLPYVENKNKGILIERSQVHGRENIPAPTTDELLEVLPWRLSVLKQSCDLLITKGPKKYSVRYIASYEFPARSSSTPTVHKLLPDALALCWLGLTKEELI